MNLVLIKILPQVVMKWTGHSDYSAMKPYIDIADQKKLMRWRSLICCNQS